MTFLLDTCVSVRLCAEPERLSEAARAAIDAAHSALLISDVSALELALKWSAGKIALPDPPRHWFEQQLSIWDLDCQPLVREDIYRAAELPQYHRDLFDRLLVAAALSRNATILTPDIAIHRYPVSCRW